LSRPLGDLLSDYCRSFLVFIVAVVAVQRRSAHYIAFNVIPEVFVPTSASLGFSEKHIARDCLSASKLGIALAVFFRFLVFPAKDIFARDSFAVPHRTQSLLGLKLGIVIGRIRYVRRLFVKVY